MLQHVICCVPYSSDVSCCVSTCSVYVWDIQIPHVVFMCGTYRYHMYVCHLCTEFLGVFSKFQNVIDSFVMSFHFEIILLAALWP